MHKLTYPGDKMIADFNQRWLEIIAGIKPESVSQEEECRELKGNSKELELGLKLYEHMERSDPAKTQKYLLNMIDRRVKATREGKSRSRITNWATRFPLPKKRRSPNRRRSRRRRMPKKSIEIENFNRRLKWFKNQSISIENTKKHKIKHQPNNQ